MLNWLSLTRAYYPFHGNHPSSYLNYDIYTTIQLLSMESNIWMPMSIILILSYCLKNKRTTFSRYKPAVASTNGKKICIPSTLPPKLPASFDKYRIPAGSCCRTLWPFLSCKAKKKRSIKHYPPNTRASTYPKLKLKWSKSLTRMKDQIHLIYASNLTNFAVFQLEIQKYL